MTAGEFVFVEGEPMDPIVYPSDGQEFHVWVAACEIDDPGMPLSCHILEVAPELSNLLGDFGGDKMTEDLFHENDIPTVPGLYRMLIKFWVIEHTDWETGAREDDYGIDVLASEKV